MMGLVIVLFAMLGASAATVLPCPAGKGPMPKSVIIEGCMAPEKCELVRGQVFKAEVEFTARKIT